VGITDFARICDLDEIDVLVIDESTPELEALCARHKIELISAPVDSVMATATG
jgi:DeoR/GlpR family transcriptional regulator of sugar metabolism